MISAASLMESLGKHRKGIERRRGDKGAVRAEWRAGLQELDKQEVGDL